MLISLRESISPPSSAFFDELMENDCKNLNENILDYKDFVKDVERVQVNKDENVVLPGTKRKIMDIVLHS
jgi:hypothetical protein